MDASPPPKAQKEMLLASLGFGLLWWMRYDAVHGGRCGGLDIPVWSARSKIFLGRTENGCVPTDRPNRLTW
ncbi:MAG: hypothetical protein KIS61_22130 [Candidatus Eremiobacteraeota bacterium]|nr:hypothetical protein [Candidatus Eremiobacteraeota bacterium]